MEKLLKITHLAVLVAAIKGWVTGFVNERIGEIPGLSKASSTELGGVKIGSGLVVDETGKASVDFTSANGYTDSAVAEANEYMESMVAGAKGYTDNKVAAAKSELIGGAPATYDTLKEIADYIAEHQEVETALNAAIGSKANSADVYTKTEVYTKADVYTKAEASALFASASYATDAEVTAAVEAALAE